MAFGFIFRQQQSLFVATVPQHTTATHHCNTQLQHTIATHHKSHLAALGLMYHISSNLFRLRRRHRTFVQRQCCSVLQCAAALRHHVFAQQLRISSGRILRRCNTYWRKCCSALQCAVAVRCNVLQHSLRDCCMFISNTRSSRHHGVCVCVCVCVCVRVCGVCVTHRCIIAGSRGRGAMC